MASRLHDAGRLRAVHPSAISLFKNWDVDTAEQAVIRTLRSCLNVAHNETPTPLPARYDRHDETTKREAVR